MNRVPTNRRIEHALPEAESPVSKDEGGASAPEHAGSAQTQRRGRRKRPHPSSTQPPPLQLEHTQSKHQFLKLTHYIRMRQCTAFFNFPGVYAPIR